MLKSIVRLDDKPFLRSAQQIQWRNITSAIAKALVSPHFDIESADEEAFRDDILAFAASRYSDMVEVKHPSPAPICGSSDPFKASAFSITADVNELLHLASRFHVFWAWPVASSSIYNARSQQDWAGDLNASLAIRSQMHAILAHGAAAKAGILGCNDPETRARAIHHHVEAIALLRQDLRPPQNANTAAALITILRLFSLEVNQGRFQAALWHHNAARKMIKLWRFPKWHDSDAKFALAEGWLATAMLRRPISKPQDFGLGLKSAEEGLSHLVVPVKFKAPDVPEDFPDAMKCLFRDMQDLVAIMQLVSQMENAEDEFAAVSWVDARGSALRAALLKMSHDCQFEFSQHTRLGDGQYLSSACLAAMCFMSIIFMFRKDRAKQENRRFMPVTILAYPLRTLQAELKQCRPIGKGSSELLNWMNFVSACGYHLHALHGDPDSSSPPELALPLAPAAQEFASLKALLSRYLYHEGLMDDFLADWVGHEDSSSIQSTR